MTTPCRMIDITLACWLPCAGLAQTATGTPAPTVDTLPQTPAVLTLEAATEQFLRRNLAVEAARFQVNVAEAEIIAAPLRPRPGLTLTGENLSISGATPFNRLYEVSATVAQTIELGNRSRLRMEVADRTVAGAKAQLASVLQRRLYELRRTYYEALLQRALFQIAQSNRADFEELVRFNTVRFQEGHIGEGELMKVRLERIRFDSAIASARLALRQANIRLLELVGDNDYDRAGSLEVRGDLALRPAAVDLNLLRQAALANRPEIKAAEAELARAESVVRLELSRGKGEIVPFFGYKRIGELDNAVIAGVTLPLPFGNRNQGGIARANAEKRVAEINLQGTRNRALAEVDSAYRTHETAREQVRAYEAGIYKEADESLQITLASYREGAAELIILLDAQRTRSEVRAGYYRALFDYQTSLFLLEQAAGVEVKP